MIITTTIKEEWTHKNDFYDNYNLVYSDTIDNYKTTFCGTAFAFCIYLPSEGEDSCWHWSEQVVIW